MNFKINEDDVYKFTYERFEKKFYKYYEELNVNDYEIDISVIIKNHFDTYYQRYKSLKAFKINENIFEKNESIDDKMLFIIRTVSQFFLTKTFEAMKIDLDDPNVKEDLSVGNIGTPGRVAKMWCGTDINDDTEFLCGRFAKPIRIASFPNNSEIKIPITKKVSLTAVCSHHLAPFSTKLAENSYAIVSYIPEKKVYGISKLQRLVEHIARRGWLQEDLVKEIYKQVSEIAETNSVYVKLVNVVHTCEFLRGAKSDDSGFTTEYYGGKFHDQEYRVMVNKDY